MSEVPPKDKETRVLGKPVQQPTAQMSAAQPPQRRAGVSPTVTEANDEEVQAGDENVPWAAPGKTQPGEPPPMAIAAEPPRAPAPLGAFPGAPPQQPPAYARVPAHVPPPPPPMPQRRSGGGGWLVGGLLAAMLLLAGGIAVVLLMRSSSSSSEPQTIDFGQSAPATSAAGVTVPEAPVVETPTATPPEPEPAPVVVAKPSYRPKPKPKSTSPAATAPLPPPPTATAPPPATTAPLPPPPTSTATTPKKSGGRLSRPKL